jgi:phage shock protein C
MQMRGKRLMKRVYRSQRGKMIWGVCAGLSEALEIDTTITRLVVVITAIFTGFFPILLFYILAAIIMPKQTSVEPEIIRVNGNNE